MAIKQTEARINGLLFGLTFRTYSVQAHRNEFGARIANGLLGIEATDITVAGNTGSVVHCAVLRKSLGRNRKWASGGPLCASDVLNFAAGTQEDSGFQWVVQLVCKQRNRVSASVNHNAWNRRILLQQITHLFDFQRRRAFNDV